MSAKLLREERAAIAAEIKNLRDLSADSKREWTAEDQTKYDEYVGKIEGLDQRIRNVENAETLNLNQRSQDDLREQFERGDRRDGDTDQTGISTRDRLVALRSWATNDRSNADLVERCGLDPQATTAVLNMSRGVGLSGEEFRAPKSVAEANEQARQRLATRAAQAVGTDNLGGFTAPDEMMRPIDVAMLAYGGMRQASTIITTSTGNDLPIPTSNDTSQEGEILGENTAANEQAVAFGQVVLSAYKYSSKLIPISIELMQDSATNMPTFLGERIGERLGRITNRHFTVGTGTNQPRGITVAATDSGVTQATSGVFDWAEIVELIHSVDPAYRQMGASFMLHDNTLMIMKKMKDSQNRPVWLPSLVPGAPDTFDNYPYVINNHMPVTNGQPGLLFGALQKYVIREAKQIELMRLNERFAEKHQVGFLAFSRYDGDLIDAGTGPVKFLTLTVA